MNQKKRKNPTAAHPTRWLWLIVAGAVILLGGGLSLVWASGQSRSVTPAETSGSPRLAVDQTMIDEGNVKLDTPIQTSFRLRNTGDQTLRILDEPRVELIEGC